MFVVDSNVCVCVCVSASFVKLISNRYLLNLFIGRLYCLISVARCLYVLDSSPSLTSTYSWSPTYNCLNMLIDYLSNLCISLILFYDLLTFEVLEKLIYSFFPFHLFSRFDITGYVTGFGHPDWVRTHEAASSTSPVVSTLVEGGATCVGKTVVDEFAFRFVSVS